MKKKLCQLQLNEVKRINDPTVLHCTFSILDFDVSHNKAIITKDMAAELAKTVLNKPIVTKYHEVEEANTPTDALGSHEARLGENRNGELDIQLNTAPIGVFTSEGYFSEITLPNGETKEVLMADAILWYSRYTDACDLLLEWYDRGININASCEILYQNYSFRDGVEYINSPVYFDGHCLLNSEKRGDHDVVLPAYESAKLVSFNQFQEFNKLVAQANEQDNENKEGENMEEKNTEQQEEVVEVKEEQPEVVEEQKTEEVVEQEEKPEDDKAEEIVEDSEQKLLQNEVVELKSKLDTLLSEQKDLESKFNEATEKLLKASSELEELKVYKEKYESEQLEKHLNEKQEYYQAKFEAVNALEKFNSDEVQSLVKESVHKTDAVLQLNSMLVELVTLPVKEKEDGFVKEMSSKRENLLPSNEDFDSRYK
ncbi:hypothetical protein [Priestia flexa]|uniref:hypothetical protein n=1 Tax=Priestia flexa TaxID=86664 RepID=UPI000473BB68|nr:hypothetical protein [Priestia flexa]